MGHINVDRVRQGAEHGFVNVKGLGLALARVAANLVHQHGSMHGNLIGNQGHLNLPFNAVR